jgi:hypothetical protein
VSEQHGRLAGDVDPAGAVAGEHERRAGEAVRREEAQHLGLERHVGGALALVHSQKPAPAARPHVIVRVDAALRLRERALRRGQAVTSEDAGDLGVGQLCVEGHAPEGEEHAARPPGRQRRAAWGDVRSPLAPRAPGAERVDSRP